MYRYVKWMNGWRSLGVGLHERSRSVSHTIYTYMDGPQGLAAEAAAVTEALVLPSCVQQEAAAAAAAGGDEETKEGEELKQGIDAPSQPAQPSPSPSSDAGGLLAPSSSASSTTRQMADKGTSSTRLRRCASLPVGP